MKESKILQSEKRRYEELEEGRGKGSLLLEGASNGEGKSRGCLSSLEKKKEGEERDIHYQKGRHRHRARRGRESWKIRKKYGGGEDLYLRNGKCRSLRGKRRKG